MTPERWARLRRLFAESYTLDDAARRQFLDDDCGDDPGLRAELESLLAADCEAERFLEVSAVEQVLGSDSMLQPSPVGRRFGAYRVLAEIGRGGMGVVYRAVRDDDAYHQEVALKLLPSGLESEVFAERFRRERQILASLEHPNIARLLDGGADETGRPYYVMELVDGEPLDAYCGRLDLGIEERIELIRTVCSAVALAHSRLVVHCDLKPANILVTADGILKLLDFGIARLVEPDQQPRPATTGWWMTPEYASPERLRGEPVTTAADVYALGVMLYELLTGRRPHDLGSGSPEEVVRAVCEQEPIRPSHVVTRSGALTGGAGVEPPQLSPAGPPDANPRRLRRRLAGDLDTIVLRALAIDPARRYGSVIQLSDDLRRHLAGLPIRARPDRFAYRAGKFVGRYRAAVVAAALAVVSLCGGLVATIQQTRVARVERAAAERRFDEVRGLARTFIFEIHDAVATLPGSTAVRARIVEVGLEYLGRLEAEATDDLGLQAELAAAYERIAAVQGGVGVANLGDREGAIRSQRRALALREAIAAAIPSEVGVQLALARAHSTLGDLLGEAGDREGRLLHAGEALKIRGAARLQAPADPAVRRAVASSQWDMAQLKVDDGDLGAGLEGFEAALETYRSLAMAAEATAGDQRNLALAYTKAPRTEEGRMNSNHRHPSRAGDLAARWALPLATVAFFVATAAGYGIFRDELYYLACARHLDWGYVDHPPLVALIGALARFVVGDSLIGLRTFPALAFGATVLLVGDTAVALGGGRWARILAQLLAVSVSKPYYFSPTYVVLFPAAAVALKGWTAGRFVHITRVLAVAAVASALVWAPLLKPLLSEDGFVRYPSALGRTPGSDENREVGRLPQLFADMHGWRELAETTARVYNALPAADRDRACVFAGNYGEAGAVDFFGPTLGLPPAISGHNSYWLWGPGGCTGEVMVVIGGDLNELQQSFAEVEAGAAFMCHDCLPEEGDLTIWVARGIRLPLATAWRSVRHYD